MNETEITQSYLSFRLGEEMFATTVLKVKEILQLTKITKVPKSPDYMKGVINLRGTVLPVIDTRMKFNMSETEETENTCIVVLSITIDREAVLLGAMVDAVLEVFDIGEDQIKPPPSIGSSYKSEFIKGIVKQEDNFIMLLNIDRIFSDDEILMVQEMSSETETQLE